MEKVSVATRCPPMNTPNVPESTSCPAISFSFSLPGTAHAACKSSRVPIRTTHAHRTLTSPLLQNSFLGQPQLAGDHISDCHDRLTRGLNAQRCSHVSWPARLVEFAKSSFIGPQGPLDRLAMAAQKKFFDGCVQKDGDRARIS